MFQYRFPPSTPNAQNTYVSIMHNAGTLRAFPQEKNIRISSRLSPSEKNPELAPFPKRKSLFFTWGKARGVPDGK
jgi:hypothetical protein